MVLISPCGESQPWPNIVNVESLASCFQSLDDPRHTRNRKHLLGDIIILCVMAVVCGCDGPTAIHRWAVCRREWLKQYLKLENGIPSRDCIRRVLIALRPEAFQSCFNEWTASLMAATMEDSLKPAQRLVAIDGKTCRSSHDSGEHLGPLHIVSAWASEEGLALGQVVTEEKSNEITAIPILLEQISLKDTIVTIDAMGCQKAIVEQIVAGGGDAVIAVKNNQPTLYRTVVSLLNPHLEGDQEDVRYRQCETHETGHGRTDHRYYYTMPVPKGGEGFEEWPGVKAIGYSMRHCEHNDGRETVEVRYYILTTKLSGKRFAEAVRIHWEIEAMHWVLDVTFREDDHRSRERSMAGNLSWLRRFAISMLKRLEDKDSIRGRMQQCGFNPEILAKVLGLQRI